MFVTAEEILTESTQYSLVNAGPMLTRVCASNGVGGEKVEKCIEMMLKFWLEKKTYFSVKTIFLSAKSTLSSPILQTFAKNTVTNYFNALPSHETYSKTLNKFGSLIVD